MLTQLICHARTLPRVHLLLSLLVVASLSHLSINTLSIPVNSIQPNRNRVHKQKELLLFSSIFWSRFVVTEYWSCLVKLLRRYGWIWSRKLSQTAAQEFRSSCWVTSFLSPHTFCFWVSLSPMNELRVFAYFMKCRFIFCRPVVSLVFPL